jgi:hypothetical protein
MGCWRDERGDRRTLSPVVETVYLLSPATLAEGRRAYQVSHLVTLGSGGVVAIPESFEFTFGWFRCGWVCGYEAEVSITDPDDCRRTILSSQEEIERAPRRRERRGYALSPLDSPIAGPSRPHHLLRREPGARGSTAWVREGSGSASAIHPRRIAEALSVNLLVGGYKDNVQRRRSRPNTLGTDSLQCILETRQGLERRKR